jgi:hypothetical protein
MQARAFTAAFLISTAALAQSHTRAAAHKPAPSDDAAIHNVFWQPNDLHQGSPMFLTVELESPADRVTGSFANHALTFFRDPHDAKTWHSLAGVVLDTAPGDYGLDIHATLANRRSAHFTKQVTVTAGDFKTGDITVPENMVNPTDAEQKQIAGDEVLKKRAYAHMTPHPLWSGDFIKPVEAASTPSFGESRILNEEKTSLHTGTDFPVKEGTPVHAANSGTVVLVRDMFYEGSCIIIDHGLGVFTIYMHLSRTDVKEGDHIEKGKAIGLSGASGRVTGPHLHLAVHWSGGWIDPVQLLALTLPQTHAEATPPRPPAHRR